MDLMKIKKQWEDYNEEFDNSDYMDIDTHTSMAMQVGTLIKEVERLQSFIETLHVVHFTELQREKSTVEKYEKALKEIRGYEAYSWNNDRDFISTRLKVLNE